MKTRLSNLLTSVMLVAVLAVTVCLSACSFLPTTNTPTPDPDGPIKYTVRYERGATDATGAIPDEQTYEEGELVTLLPSTTFTRSGYTFTVWSDGSSTYNSGVTFTMPAHDVTLTAQWRKNSSTPPVVDDGKKSCDIDMSGVAVRAGADGHVYLSVSGSYSGYTAQDFDMDMQLQGGAYPIYKKNVTVALRDGTYTVTMDISDATANSNGQFYTIHLFVNGVSKNVASSTDPWIVETSATDDNKIYKLKSDYIGWGSDAFVMKITVEQRSSQFTSADYLKVNGTDVKKNYGNGDTVMLRGTNAGGYLVTERWMTAVNYNDYKTASEVMSNRFGEQTMQDLWAYYRSYYWTDQDFKNCADMGMTAIRLPFTYMNVDYNQNGNYDFSVLDDFVRGASKYGIYTILDLHGAYGSQNGQDHSGQEMNASQVDFYTNADNRAKTVALWNALATHYKGNPAVAGFDVLNEPGVKGGNTTQTQWDFFNELYRAIREVDTDRIVIFESCWTGSNLPQPSQYGWVNCMYSFHHYVGETDENGQEYSLDQLKAKMRERVDDLNNKNFGIPVYMGEFTCYGNEEFWKYTLNLFQEYGWHWTSWTYKTNYSMGGWGIYHTPANSPNLETDSIYDIKDKWRGVSVRWSSETAFSSGTKLKDIFKSFLHG